MIIKYVIRIVVDTICLDEINEFATKKVEGLLWFERNQSAIEIFTVYLSKYWFIKIKKGRTQGWQKPRFWRKKTTGLVFKGF